MSKKTKVHLAGMKILQKLGIWIKKNWFILVVLGFGLILRAVYPLTRSFAFQFDHGKDSLAVMDMLVNGELKFVGPWTSIPGLFFGPFWYYFLAVCYLIGGFDPAAGVWGMVILGLVQVWLMYKYFGKLPAVVVATGALWLTISSSAWNPFPLTLVSLGILIIFQQIEKLRQVGRGLVEVPWWLMLLLGGLAGLGFSFSSAYAAFYFLIIPISLWIGGWKWNWKQVGWLILGVGLPFVPQILFELKNNFGEVKAVGNYFGAGGEAVDAFGGAKIAKVWTSAWYEIRQAFLPVMKTVNPEFNRWWLLGVTIVFLLIVGWWSWRKWVKKDKSLIWTRMMTICLVFIGLPLLGLTFLHFNIWYLLGMMPAVVILTSEFFKVTPKWFKGMWMLTLGITALTGIYTLWKVDNFFKTVPTFIQAKETMIGKIEDFAQGRDYRVFVKAADIYDFGYQYLWLREMKKNPEAVRGLKEFTYQPRAEEYVKEKGRLLRRLGGSGMDEAVTSEIWEEKKDDELIFYIIEGDSWGPDFDEWRGRQLEPNKDKWRELLTLKKTPDEPEELWLYVVEPKDEFKGTLETEIY